MQSLHLSPNLATVVWHWIEPCEVSAGALCVQTGEPVRSSLSSRKSSWTAGHFSLSLLRVGSLPSQVKSSTGGPGPDKYPRGRDETAPRPG